MFVCKFASCIMKKHFFSYFGSSRSEVSLKLISGSKLSDLQLYFKGIFEDFGHTFLTCSKEIIRILKVGKVFQCVTFYQYFFMNDKTCYQLIVAPCINNINNSLTMISMRVTWHDFYTGLVCQNCFAHSLLVSMVLFMALSNFLKRLIRSNTMH